ncbi:MAG: AraC family transcriptional regulator [Kiritimatiellae bacterium]|jgi:AraC family 4-hydroxyphenylacetate 3-monooxygenase operon regulatory protein|nr:AraC family transcriptional regulator [Kiritimatiellia bacterium]
MKRAFVSFGSLTQRELPLHRNIGMEVFYVSEGRLKWRVDDKVEEVPPGSVFFTLPWQVHGSAYVHEPGNLVHFVQFRLDKIYRQPIDKFKFHPWFGISNETALILSTTLSSATQHTWHASEQLRWAIHTLVEKLEADAEELFIRGLFRCMLSELHETVSGNRNIPPLLNSTERRVQKFLDRMKAEVEQPWTLSEMAGNCKLARSHFASIVKKLTGDSPLAYLRRLRVLHAEKLLRDTDLSVTEIGHACGFATSQHYARVFKHYTNCTATLFRRRCHEDHKREIQEFTEEDERQRFAEVRKQKWV